ncbi:hypothetical protein KQ879_15100, partial [Listeria monocytogenes]|nr:hypothetical protein [Listeria monocytogenes]
AGPHLLADLLAFADARGRREADPLVPFGGAPVGDDEGTPAAADDEKHGTADDDGPTGPEPGAADAGTSGAVDGPSGHADRLVLD